MNKKSDLNIFNFYFFKLSKNYVEKQECKIFSCKPT